jgi:hypothetical protein
LLIKQTPPQLNDPCESLFGHRENVPERLSMSRRCYHQSLLAVSRLFASQSATRLKYDSLG